MFGLISLVWIWIIAGVVGFVFWFCICFWAVWDGFVFVYVAGACWIDSVAKVYRLGGMSLVICLKYCLEVI